MAEEKRCIHEMIEGTCSLCKGYKQTGSIGLTPNYIPRSSFEVTSPWDLTTYNENTMDRLRATSGKGTSY